MGIGQDEMHSPCTGRDLRKAAIRNDLLPLNFSLVVEDCTRPDLRSQHFDPTGVTI